MGWTLIIIWQVLVFDLCCLCGNAICCLEIGYHKGWLELKMTVMLIIIVIASSRQLSCYVHTPTHLILTMTLCCRHRYFTGEITDTLSTIYLKSHPWSVVEMKCKPLSLTLDSILLDIMLHYCHYSLLRCLTRDVDLGVYEFMGYSKP